MATLENEIKEKAKDLFRRRKDMNYDSIVEVVISHYPQEEMQLILWNIEEAFEDLN